MAEATIPVKQDVKDLVDAEKRDGETYNGLLRRLLGEAEQTEWTQDEIEQIADERARQMFERLARGQQ